MIKELKPTNLLAADFPANALNFKTASIDTNWIFYTLEGLVKKTLLPKGNYKILGEVTKDKIGFDVEPYLDSNIISMYGVKDYKDYIDSGNRYQQSSKSFYSLLAANGIYFYNPMEKPDLSDANGRQYDKSINEDNEWAKYRSFEDNLIKGKLLIIEKIK
jgi:hypothetical protein